MREAIRAHRLGDRLLLLQDLNLAHDEALEEGQRGMRRGVSGNQEQSIDGVAINSNQ